MDQQEAHVVLEDMGKTFSFLPGDGEWVCRHIKAGRVTLSRVSVRTEPGLPAWTASGLRSPMSGVARASWSVPRPRRLA